MQNEVIILDSNIWISYVITKQLQTLVALIHKHQLTVLTSENLVEEIQRESNYWLRIIKRTVTEVNTEELDSLIKESGELKNILGSIVQKTR